MRQRTRRAVRRVSDFQKSREALSFEPWRSVSTAVAETSMLCNEKTRFLNEYVAAVDNHAVTVSMLAKTAGKGEAFKEAFATAQQAGKDAETAHWPYGITRKHTAVNRGVIFLRDLLQSDISA